MAKIPTAGELRHTCEVIHRTETGKDGHGQPIYSDSIEIPDGLFKIEQLSGRDIEYARQLYHEATYRLQARASSLIYTGAFIRVVATGKLFAIGSAIDLDERGIWVEVLATETTAEEMGLNIQ